MYNYNLPFDISVHDEEIGDDCIWTFSHKEMGVLGVMVLHQGKNETSIHYKIPAEGGDLVVKRKEEIVRPIVESWTKIITKELGIENKNEIVFH